MILPENAPFRIGDWRIDPALERHRHADTKDRHYPSGYGVQPVQQAIAVEVVARRCGGEVRMNGEPGRRAALQVYFTRCGPAQPTRASVKKSLDRSGVSAEHWSSIPD